MKRVKHHARRWVNTFITLMLIAGCQTQTADTPLSTSLWGQIITLGTAEQPAAPSIWVSESRLTATWVGADDTGIHQDMRVLDGDGLGARVVLPLPPKNPRDQQLIPATNGNLHLLWLDQNDENETRLFTAVISAGQTVVRGPIQLTDEVTYHYAVIPNSDGSALVISSGGMAFQPGLYARYIDHEGRPYFQESYQITPDGNWPALSRANDGTVFLYWLRPSDGQVMRGTFENGQIESAEAITESVTLNKGDRLVGFNGGLDRTSGYLFWNVTRSSGQNETWFTSGLLKSSRWEAPKRLGISITSAIFEPGFNSGTAQTATLGDEWVQWTSAMIGQYDMVAAATVLPSGELGIVYFQDGQVAGMQSIVSRAHLIGAPTLLTDRDRFLYLAWSETNSTGQGELRLTTSRRSP